MALDWIGCIFLDGDDESSGVVRGVLHGGSSLLVMVMSESSITESNKVAEKFGMPQLGYSQGHEYLSNTEIIFVSTLTQTAFYQVLHDSRRMLDMAPLQSQQAILQCPHGNLGGFGPGLVSMFPLNTSEMDIKAHK